VPGYLLSAHLYRESNPRVSQDHPRHQLGTRRMAGLVMPWVLSRTWNPCLPVHVRTVFQAATPLDSTSAVGPSTTHADCGARFRARRVRCERVEFGGAAVELGGVTSIHSCGVGGTVSQISRKFQIKISQANVGLTITCRYADVPYIAKISQNMLIGSNNRYTVHLRSKN
jgi:hypothetical protein